MPVITTQRPPNPVQVDGGSMYRWMLQEQDRLCPGTCWAVGAGTQESQHV